MPKEFRESPRSATHIRIIIKQALDISCAAESYTAPKSAMPQMMFTSRMLVAVAAPRKTRPSAHMCTLGEMPPSRSTHAAMNSAVFQSTIIGHCTGLGLEFL